jgi:hypothetical protein
MFSIPYFADRYGQVRENYYHQIHSQNFSLTGWGEGADPEPIYNLILKNYVIKIMHLGV